MDTASPDEELGRLRSELADWRRRAEVAEATSAERLARAEAAERTLEATNAALRRVGSGPVEVLPGPAAGQSDAVPVGDEPPTLPSGRSLRERWRRYVETIN